MSRAFAKYHIRRLPLDIVLHHFTSVAGENAHDHPFECQSIILFGGYTERIYTSIGASHEVFRAPGTTHLVAADCIHELIDLPRGEASGINAGVEFGRSGPDLAGFYEEASQGVGVAGSVLVGQSVTSGGPLCSWPHPGTGGR